MTTIIILPSMAMKNLGSSGVDTDGTSMKLPAKGQRDG